MHSDRSLDNFSLVDNSPTLGNFLLANLHDEMLILQIISTHLTDVGPCVMGLFSRCDPWKAVAIPSNDVRPSLQTCVRVCVTTVSTTVAALSRAR